MVDCRSGAASAGREARPAGQRPAGGPRARAARRPSARPLPHPACIGTAGGRALTARWWSRRAGRSCCCCWPGCRSRPAVQACRPAAGGGAMPLRTLIDCWRARLCADVRKPPSRPALPPLAARLGGGGGGEAEAGQLVVHALLRPLLRRLLVLRGEVEHHEAGRVAQALGLRGRRGAGGGCGGGRARMAAQGRRCGALRGGSRSGSLPARPGQIPSAGTQAPHSHKPACTASRTAVCASSSSTQALHVSPCCHGRPPRGAPAPPRARRRRQRPHPARPPAAPSCGRAATWQSGRAGQTPGRRAWGEWLCMVRRACERARVLSRWWPPSSIGGRPRAHTLSNSKRCPTGSRTHARTRTVRSSQAVASFSPSGLHDRPVTSAQCPRSPVRKSLEEAWRSAAWCLR